MSNPLTGKRDSSTAVSMKRTTKDNLARQNLSETNGFNQYGGSLMRNQLTAKQEKQLVKEAEMEFKRRGKFKRVFPSVDYHYYRQFFNEERPLNYILDQRLMSKRRLSNVA